MAHYRRYDASIEALGAPIAVRAVASRPEQKGAFAVRNIAAGEVLWREAPILSVQHVARRQCVAVCVECCRWVGGGVDMLDRVIKWATGATAAARSLPAPDAAISCQEDCGAVYCSVECRSMAWKIHHRMLCTGCGAAATPDRLSKGAAIHRGALLCYERLADKADCRELLELLARSVSDVLGVWDAEGRTDAGLASAMSVYDSLHCVHWWDVPGRGSEAALRPLVQEAVRLLDLALLPCHRRETPALFAVDRCARLLGGFESNLLSVEIECPAIQRLALDERAKVHSHDATPVGDQITFPTGMLQQAAAAVATRAAATRAAAARTNRASLVDTMVMDAGLECSASSSSSSSSSSLPAITIPSPANFSTSSLTAQPFLSDSWPRSEGVGLFDLISTVNHSCVPSCCVSYTDSHVACITATRAIESGEELSISYIDTRLDYANRQRELADYGFSCECEKCQCERK